jgi:hypothetical protein
MADKFERVYKELTKEAAKTGKPIAMDPEGWQAGYNAGLKGLPRENPYRAGGDQALAWIAGFNLGRERRRCDGQGGRRAKFARLLRQHFVEAKGESGRTDYARRHRRREPATDHDQRHPD